MSITLSRLSFSKLPEEIWIRIFEFMTRPSELFNVITTCWKFYALGIRSLYRSIDWKSPYDYTNNLPFWHGEGARMWMVPSTLVLGISCIQTLGFASYDPSVVQVGLSTQYRPTVSTLRADMPTDSALSPSRTRHVASASLYASLVDTVLLFSNVKELIFHDCNLPSFVYKLIDGLHQLRHLTLHNCVLPPSTSNIEIDFENLPLKSLTLIGIIGNSELQLSSNYVHVLRLCGCKNLQMMRVDWTAMSSAYLAQWRMDSGYLPPVALKSLALHVPPLSLTQQDHDISHHSLAEPLFAFLKRCIGVEELLLDGLYPSFTLPTPFLPNLKRFYGPITHGVLSMLSGRPIEHLTIGSEPKLGHLLDFLPRIAEYAPGLLSLTISLKNWDDEIIFAVVHHFPNLAVLQIRYRHEHPSHQTLLSLGAIHLCKMRNLQRLVVMKVQLEDAQELYRPSTTGVGPQRMFGQGALSQIQHPHAPSQTASTSTTDWTPTSSLPPSPSSSSLPSPSSPSNSIPITESPYAHRGHRQVRDIFRSFTDPVLSLDQEFKDFMLSWNKHCRKLIEVQFVPGVVWRRCGEGDEWCKRMVDKQWEYEFAKTILDLPL
ncbi:hypothetical protein AX16_003315 [Volvariella volvacea WC 439]|nr:hypothetical protein AX16_003315 [Volvariella volvacea WC 439]